MCTACAPRGETRGSSGRARRKLPPGALLFTKPVCLRRECFELLSLNDSRKLEACYKFQWAEGEKFFETEESPFSFRCFVI